VTRYFPFRDSITRCASRVLRSINVMNCLVRRGNSFRPHRILVVKLDAIGDLVIATPFLRELKASFPTAAITLVVTPTAAPLVDLCPYVDKVIKYDPFGSDRNDREFNTLRARLFALKLSFARYDLAVLPRWDFDFSHAYYLLCGSGARHVVGFERTFTAVKNSWWARAERRGATVLDDELPEHEVLRNLRLLEAVGGTIKSDELELWLSPVDRRRAAEWLESRASSHSGPTIGFGIGAGIEQRCWPAEKFAQLARYLVEKFDARVILFGHGMDDRRRAEAILERTRTLAVSSAVDQLRLRETAALMGSCQLFIGNDSGPMHLAAAATIPIVEISGLAAGEDPNSNFAPERFGPWKVPARVVRPPAAPFGERRQSPDDPLLRIRAVGVTAVLKSSLDLLNVDKAQLAVQASSVCLESEGRSTHPLTYETTN
jgi:ADP-heptose:LPS heptosyltransferase